MSTAAGNIGEDQAVDYLHSHGYKLIDRNWRTRYCEIDVIAQKDKVIWFVEVKARKSSGQGYGYEYVTPKKLQQMRFAAEMWVQSNSWTGEYQLGVISVDAGNVSFITDL